MRPSPRSARRLPTPSSAPRERRRPPNPLSPLISGSTARAFSRPTITHLRATMAAPVPPPTVFPPPPRPRSRPLDVQIMETPPPRPRSRPLGVQIMETHLRALGPL